MIFFLNFKTFQVLDERLSNLEQSLSDNIPVPKDIYARIKAMEDRMILLERSAPGLTSSAQVTELICEAERKAELSQSLLEINNEIAMLKKELSSG